MSFINFSKASCKNCYKCLRSCPVKAVRFSNEQAEIDEKRCIACGHCLVICPQDARNIKSDIDMVKEAIKGGRTVCASIAPSFPAAFDISLAGRIASVLRKLGFSYVEETAAGADIISDIYLDYLKKPGGENLITTSCPAANNLVERYYPDLVKYMIPVVSPMIAHGRMMKRKYGIDGFNVFIGPCITKKHESMDFQNAGAIDAVLTFDELKKWIAQEQVDIAGLEENAFDGAGFGHGRLFPVYSGLIGGGSDFKYDIVHAEGTEECMELFDGISRYEIAGVCVVANVCSGGCIGGPGMPGGHSIYKRKRDVLEYGKGVQGVQDACTIQEYKGINLSRIFTDRSILDDNGPEEEIDRILKAMGKFEPQDELNCGVCGYNTCRQKAQAVYEGMAETSMCLHYMRTKAESLRNMIFENTPNIILILDGNMMIKEINPPAERVFNVRSEDVRDRHISQLIDSHEYYRVKETRTDQLRHKISLPQYNVVLREDILYLEKQDIILVIMKDITKEETGRKELSRMRENTLSAAQQVINKQMMVAQQIAGLLGETTAETKVILTRIKKLVAGEDGEQQ